jgi:hypothetical protein
MFYSIRQVISVRYTAVCAEALHFPNGIFLDKALPVEVDHGPLRKFPLAYEGDYFIRAYQFIEEYGAVGRKQAKKTVRRKSAHLRQKMCRVDLATADPDAELNGDHL